MPAVLESCKSSQGRGGRASHQLPHTPPPPPLPQIRPCEKLLILPGSVGVGVTSTPLYTLNSFTAGSLFLPATLDTKTRNSYLEPLSRPVTLYSWVRIFLREFQCTYFPSAVSLLYSTIYRRSGSPPSFGGRVHFSVKLVLFNHVTLFVMV